MTCESLIHTLPRIPLTSEEGSRLREQVSAAMGFCRSWGGPICLERCGEEMILMPYHYYKQRYGDFDQVPTTFDTPEDT